jgi:hypothetical protein
VIDDGCMHAHAGAAQRSPAKHACKDARAMTYAVVQMHCAVANFQRRRSHGRAERVRASHMSWLARHQTKVESRYKSQTARALLRSAVPQRQQRHSARAGAGSARAVAARPGESRARQRHRVCAFAALTHLLPCGVRRPPARARARACLRLHHARARAGLRARGV